MASGSNTPIPNISKEGGVVIFHCPEPGCIRTFTKQANYVSHSRTHTGETPYRCNICGARFRWQSSEKAHLRSHERHRMRQSMRNPSLESAVDTKPSPPPPPPSPPPSLPPPPPPPPHNILPGLLPPVPRQGPRLEPLEPPAMARWRRDPGRSRSQSGASATSSIPQPPPPPFPPSGRRGGHGASFDHQQPSQHGIGSNVQLGASSGVGNRQGRGEVKQEDNEAREYRSDHHGST